MKRLINWLLFFILPGVALAQQTFIQEGRIEFERRINVHRQLDDERDDLTWFKDLVARLPQYHSSTFTMFFKEDQTIYKPLGEINLPNELPYIVGPAKENTIRTDLSKNTRSGYKTIYEEKFVISDTLRKMQWKITDEKRTIAGLECRKAVAIICDSVYVVAFYADEIPVSGGPESFDGLPGMILGLVIPRLHTTWFATKIVMTPPASQDFEIAFKGQRIQKSKLRSTLQSSFQNWGKYGERNLWWVML